MSPLPMNGSLVMGHEQDSYDGDYSYLQNFMGRLTGFHLWDFKFSEDQIQNWMTCGIIQNALLSWIDLPWILHNTTGELKILPKDMGPCSQEQNSTLLLFINRMSWQAAQTFLQDKQLNMVVPHNAQESTNIANIMQNYGQSCKNDHYQEIYVWLGVMQSSGLNNSDYILDVNTNKTLTYTPWNNVTYMKIKFKTEEKCCSAQGLDGHWTIAPKDSSLCFLGVEEEVALPYYLAGECGFKEIFILTGYHRNSLFFYGVKNMRIWRTTNNAWVLWDVMKKNKLAMVKTKHLPLGHRSWTLLSKFCGLLPNTTTTFTLTNCKGFTCPNGECIKWDQRCDQQADCPGGFDEDNCHTAEYTSYYSPLTPPPAPFLLKLHIKVNRVTSVDLVRMMFDVDFVLTVKWKDPRLQYQNLHLITSLVLPKKNEPWKPKLSVKNSLDTADKIAGSVYIHQEGQGTHIINDTLYRGDENSLSTKFHMRLSAYCDIHLQRFPWVQHQCSVLMKIPNVRETETVYDPASSVTQVMQAMVGTYKIVDWNLRIQNNSPSFALLLSLHQQAEYHIWTVYLPTTLLMAIGYGTLFLPAERFPERGGMSLTTLLVLISLYTDASAALPNTSYIKLIDIWFVFSISFLSLIIAVHLATCKTDDLQPTFKGQGEEGWLAGTLGREQPL
ncbi:hypothetical protein Pcinc_030547 [Petrolisthes cinctipes]|uniref:Pentraxin (PTX) domain-containing protein n=1 Tax=Petrolisthes cinctipes TaxID=88211 RepID=A0AAE1K4A4_PETCI|nr:hypothetical protein Pcinc_030547 [Petrolisthes cinctipes]